MHCALLLNPQSRSASAAEPELLRLLQARDAQLAMGGPREPQQLPAMLADAGPQPIERILIGGGDGTLNRALPDLIAAQLPVAVLPPGPANDFARNLGLASDLGAAVETALTGRVHAVDVAMVNDRPFLNVATIGLGPKVTTHLTGELKARLGFLGYPRALISAYRRSRPFRVGLRGGDFPPLQLHCLHLAIGNGRYYGGGAVVARDARVDDGRLEVAALKPTAWWRLLLQAPLVAVGWQNPAPDAAVFSTRTLTVTTRHPKPVSADGELLAETPADFALRPGALSVVMPAGTLPAIGG
jgi:YegS/Rv2252/BmrU family lipid kinase